jgi:hypothetical protein
VFSFSLTFFVFPIRLSSFPFLSVIVTSFHCFILFPSLSLFLPSSVPHFLLFSWSFYLFLSLKSVSGSLHKKMGTRGSFPRGGADHSPPSSAEVKEWVELYLHSPIHLYGVVIS